MSAGTASRARLRGEPLVALVLVAVIWVSFRASSWAFELAPEGAETGDFEPAPMALAAPSSQPVRRAEAVVTEPAEAEQAIAGKAVMRLDMPRSGRMAPKALARARKAAPVRTFAANPVSQQAAGQTPVRAVRVALPPAQTAALAQQVTGASAAAAPAPYRARSEAATVDRWSADAWVFWRRGSDAPVTPGSQGYGRSQAGAVIRLAMVPASVLRPQAHLRASAALEGPREREVAAGISARPVPPLPARVAAEARVTETDFGTEVRPAVYAVTQIPPFDLPAGLTGETYVQGGYVGGTYDTAFIDGQLGIVREFSQSHTSRFRLGAGIWGGAQRGASRLDIGPSAQFAFRIGGANARLSADYRFRIAGDARPASGPALTLSAGF